MYKYIKMVNKYCQTKQRKTSKKSMWMVPKSFWRRKRKKPKKMAWDRYKNLSEEEKKASPSSGLK